MRIRKVKVRDAEEIYQLRNDTFEKINVINYSSMQIKALIDSNFPEKIIKKMKEREMFCLEDGKQILGVVDLKKNKIGGLFIRYNFIGRGYGRKLMEFIEDFARKKGIKKVFLCPTEYAKDFYKRLGYTQLKKKNKFVIKGIKFDQIIMEKNLK